MAPANYSTVTLVLLAALVTSLFRLPVVEAEIAHHTILSNPVVRGASNNAIPTPGKGNIAIPAWPNFMSHASRDSFMGQCGVNFTHHSSAACVNPKFRGSCGRQIHVHRDLSKTVTAQAMVNVVDFCEDLPVDGLRITADAFARLGGRIGTKDLPHVTWAFDGPPPDSEQEEAAARSTEIKAVGGLFFGFALWGAGILLLM